MKDDPVTKLHGYSDDPAVAKEVMLELHSGGEWVYVEVVDSCVQVWSGLACLACELTMEGLKRCRQHSRVTIIALQLRLVGLDQSRSIANEARA